MSCALSLGVIRDGQERKVRTVRQWLRMNGYCSLSEMASEYETTVECLLEQFKKLKGAK